MEKKRCLAMSENTKQLVIITTVSNGKRTLAALPGVPSTTVRMDFGNIIKQNVDNDIFSDDEIVGTRKRRRLTNLSPEQKLQRRKLKNRVAAQTARDRKRVLMDELEEQLASLEEENKRLARENAELKAHSGSLLQENDKLKERLGVVAAMSIKTESGSHGSAVPLVPLPQGQIQALSLWMMQYTTSVIILSLMAFLVCFSNSNPSAHQLTVLESRKKGSKELNLAVTAQKILVPPWWGPQQQNWNPSMN